MTQYEYLIVESDQSETTRHVQETFTQYGLDGWDLVCMTKKVFVFKRPVPVDA